MPNKEESARTRRLRLAREKRMAVRRRVFEVGREILASERVKSQRSLDRKSVV